MERYLLVLSFNALHFTIFLQKLGRVPEVSFGTRPITALDKN